MTRGPSWLHRRLLGLQAGVRDLRRRRVFQSAAAYAVGAWVIVEISSVVLPAFGLPDVALRVVIGLALVGFPVAVGLAWTFDVTARGIVRTDEVDEAAAAELMPPEEEPAPEPKSLRRRMTVLCAALDLEDGAADTDPERLLEIQPRATARCRRVCARFEGHVVPGRSGEVVAYFGYPVAHEDEAQRAVRAGLGIVEAVRRLNADGPAGEGARIAARVAIHTDEVVTEESAEGEGAARIVGVLPGLTASLMDQCGRDEVWITADVQQVVRGYFDLLPLGERALGAGSRILPVFRARHESSARTRLDARAEEGLLPLVGRQHELGLLRQSWSRAQRSLGEIVLVTGESGIGKSRIVRALKEHAAECADAWLIEQYCHPQHRNSVLHPLIEFLRRDVLDLSGDEDGRRSLQRIEGLLAEYVEDLEEAVPLLAALVDVPLAGSAYQPLGYSAQRQREATLELVIDLLLHRADRQPVLFVIEDLHWADPTTIALLTILVEQAPASRILGLFTARPAFDAPWSGASGFSQLSLEGLSTDAAEEICKSIPGSERLPRAVVEQIVARADGVPLFVEEVSRTLIDTGLRDGGLDAPGLRAAGEPVIPVTLQDALTARIDSLAPTTKPVVQLAAVIGRDFTQELVLKVAERVGVGQVVAGLEDLVTAGIIHRLGRGQRTRFRFKHSLLLDTAYRLLLRRDRQRFHGEIADLVAAEFAEIGAQQPELLAGHYLRAGRAEASLPYWMEAGSRAAQRSANQEAAAHLRQALELLPEVPDGSGRLELELAIHTALGPVLMALKGYPAPEVEATYLRAKELCDAVGETPRVVPVLAGLWAYHQVRANLDAALGHAERLSQLGESMANDDVVLESDVFLGCTELHLGRFEASAGHLTSALERYDPEAHGRHAYVYGQDPAMAAYVYRADIGWLQGRPSEAHRDARAGIAHARSLEHPHSLAFALAIAARVMVRHRDVAQTKEWAQEALELATRFGFPVWGAMARIFLTWVSIREGGAAQGVGALRAILDAYKRQGVRLSAAYYNGLLAEVHGEREEYDEALALVDEALEESLAADRHGEPEIRRIKGELLWRRGREEDAAAAEGLLREGVRLAQAFGAGGWHLRGALTLAQLLQSRGATAEARDVLAAGLGTFGPDDDGHDLAAARRWMEQAIA